MISGPFPGCVPQIIHGAKEMMHEDSSTSMHSNMHTYVHVKIPKMNATLSIAFHGETWYNIVSMYLCINYMLVGCILAALDLMTPSMHPPIE
jgi:hypothetical protein